MSRDTSSLISFLDDARDQLLLACESLNCDGQIQIADVRGEVMRALGALVTARREASVLGELGSADARPIPLLSGRIDQTGSRKPRPRGARRAGG
jgi:hypothetical protein